MEFVRHDVKNALFEDSDFSRWIFPARERTEAIDPLPDLPSERRRNQLKS